MSPALRLGGAHLSDLVHLPGAQGGPPCICKGDPEGTGMARTEAQDLGYRALVVLRVPWGPTNA